MDAAYIFASVVRLLRTSCVFGASILISEGFYVDGVGPFLILQSSYIHMQGPNDMGQLRIILRPAIPFKPRYWY
ncbi:hypothetical protein BKA66DRAFT_505775 [Pyrenochaeta sp. MPI-SDFR-AT-0127]|nr:hypothetical protein BKA66DRAFT_505775 [Pyrenochaeta sp. MPI-SDFR-AT-0127]